MMKITISVYYLINILDSLKGFTNQFKNTNKILRILSTFPFTEYYKVYKMGY